MAATSTLAARPVRRGRPYRSVLATYAALGVTVGTWGARVPDVRVRTGLDEGALGAALLGLALGAVAGSWLGNGLLRRHGTRPVLTGAWVAMAVALVPPGLAGSWGSLAGAVTVLGVAMGVVDVAMNGAGLHLDGLSEVPLFSGLHAGWSAGVLVGTGAGAVAVAAGLAPGVHLALVAGVLVLAAATHGPHLPASHGAAVAEALHEEGAARPGARLAALAGVCGATFLANGALLDWSGVLVREDLGGGPGLGALAVTGLAAGSLVGRLAGDHLTARWGPDRLLRVGAMVTVGALLAVLADRWTPAVPLLFLLAGAGVASSVPLAFAAAGRLHGDRGLALVTTAGYGCHLVGPALIGGLAHAASLRVALLVPVVLVALTATLAWSTASGAGGPSISTR